MFVAANAGLGYWGFVLCHVCSLQATSARRRREMLTPGEAFVNGFGRKSSRYFSSASRMQVLAASSFLKCRSVCLMRRAPYHAWPAVSTFVVKIDIAPPTAANVYDDPNTIGSVCSGRHRYPIQGYYKRHLANLPTLALQTRHVLFADNRVVLYLGAGE